MPDVLPAGVSDEMPDIVVVGIDTLRPDHLGCYGYPRPTSPGLDALAAQSVVFDTTCAAGIPTTPAFTTLFTGLHPLVHRVVTHPARHRLGGDVRTLPQLAQAAGYFTAACDNLVVQGQGRGSWFARGFEQYSGFVYTPFQDQSARITDAALSLAAERRDAPMLLFVHYWDPHTPYGPRPPYDTMHYTPGSASVDLADVRALAPDYYDVFLSDMRLRHPEDYAYVVAQYDGEISQVDAQVRRLADGLSDLGRFDDAIFVVLSDHGECFGEGDFHFDHHGLYDAVTRTVLTMRVPGVEPGRCGALVSHEDLLPTLCDLAGIPLPSYPLTGRSLRPLLTDPTAPGRDAVVTVESTRQASLSLRTPTHKLIQPITELLDGTPLPDFYGRARSADPLLFDLTEDPGEKRDVAAERPDLTARLRAELARRAGELLARTDGPDPLRTQGLGLPYEHFLRRLTSRHGGH
ncbi:sulfatase [Actinopolymorpha pittospori]